LALAFIIGLILLACQNPADSEPAGQSLSEKYTGVKGSKTCELTITRNAGNTQTKAKVFSRSAFNPAEGDSYVLKIIENGATQTSSGTVKAFSGNKFTLAPSINVSVSFEVTINNSGITNISGTITIQSGATIPGPSEITPGSNPGGNTSVPPGGNTSVPPGNTSVPPGNTSVPPGNTSVPGTHVPVTGVSLNKTSLTLTNIRNNPHYFERLIVTVSPSNATNQNVNWESSDLDVVALYSGEVYAFSVGTTKITVTTVDGNKTATCDVTVTGINRPKDVSAKATSYTSITVSWSPVANADGYYVYDMIEGLGNKIICEGGATTSYSFTNLKPGMVYYFSVTAYNSEGESRPSEHTGAIRTPIEPPSNVSATATSSSSITVSWSPVSGADSYGIWYGKTSSANDVKKTSINGTSYTVTGLQAGTTYYFRVYAQHDYVLPLLSDDSLTVSATTLP